MCNSLKCCFREDLIFCKHTCMSDGKTLWQFNRAFLDKQWSSLGSHEKISLQFVKSICLYVGLNVVMRGSLDGAWILYSEALLGLQCSAVMILAAFWHWSCFLIWVRSQVNQRSVWFGILFKYLHLEKCVFILVTYIFLMEGNIFYEYNQNEWPRCLTVASSHSAMTLDSSITWYHPLFLQLLQHCSLMVFWCDLPDISGSGFLSGSSSSSKPLNINDYLGFYPQVSSHFINLSWIISFTSEVFTTTYLLTL